MATASPPCAASSARVRPSARAPASGSPRRARAAKRASSARSRRAAFTWRAAPGARILPVAVIGTSKILPAKGARVSDDVNVKVVVRPPVDPKDHPEPQFKGLMAAVRERISEGLA